MTIKKIVYATAIALALGTAVTAQAASFDASAIDHVTADTNPAAFAQGNTTPLLGNNVAGSGTVSHIVEDTQPHTLGGDAKSNTVDAERVIIDLPYQRG